MRVPVPLIAVLTPTDVTSSWGSIVYTIARPRMVPGFGSRTTSNVPSATSGSSEMAGSVSTRVVSMPASSIATNNAPPGKPAAEMSNRASPTSCRTPTPKSQTAFCDPSSALVAGVSDGAYGATAAAAVSPGAVSWSEGSSAVMTFDAVTVAPTTGTAWSLERPSSIHSRVPRG